MDDIADDATLSPKSTPHVLTRTVIPGLVNALDASDVLECYALVGQRSLNGIPGSDLKIQKMALGFRYRAPNAQSSRIKPPMELTLEYGPQRVGATLQDDSMPYIQTNDPIPHVAWVNEGTVYYTTSISATQYTSAYYMASMTGAVLNKILSDAVDFASGRRRYQPFAVYSTANGKELKSSSSTDFTHYMWQHLINLGVEVEPILAPPDYEARLWVDQISKVSIESSVNQDIAHFYQNLYQCIGAIATGDYSKYQPTASPTISSVPTTSPSIAPTSDPTSDLTSDPTSDPTSEQTPLPTSESSSTSQPSVASTLPESQPPSSIPGINDEILLGTESPSMESNHTSSRRGENHNLNSRTLEGEDTAIENTDGDEVDTDGGEVDVDGDQIDIDGDEVDTEIDIDINIDIETTTSNAVGVDAVVDGNVSSTEDNVENGNLSTEENVIDAPDQTYPPTPLKESEAASSVVVQAAMAAILSGDGAIMSSIISTCFSDPMYNIGVQGNNGSVSAIAYLYKDGNDYYRLNMTSPFIDVAKVENKFNIPYGSKQESGGGDFIDGMLAFVVLGMVLLGFLILLQQVGFHVHESLWKYQQWFFRPQSSSNEHDLEDGERVLFQFGEDAIPLSMGGRRTTVSPIGRSRGQLEATDIPDILQEELCLPRLQVDRVLSPQSVRSRNSSIGDVELRPISSTHLRRANSGSDGSIDSVVDELALQHDHIVPERFTRDPDHVDLPDLKSRTKVAVPVGISSSNGDLLDE